MLAGIIRGPNRFSPFRHYERAEKERDSVLARMVKLEMVSVTGTVFEKEAPLLSVAVCVIRAESPVTTPLPSSNFQ